MLVCTGSSCRHREGRMCVSEVTCADDEKEKGHAGRHTEGDLRAACRAGKKRKDHLALRNARMKASHEGFTSAGPCAALAFSRLLYLSNSNAISVPVSFT